MPSELISPLFLAAALLLGAAAEVPPDTIRLDFTPEVQNLQVAASPLRSAPPRGVTVCPGVAGETRYGRLPFRAAGAGASSRESFLHFAAAYGGGGLPRVLIDLDQNREIGCGETLPLLTDERRPGRAFRTLTLTRQGQDRPQRYRLSLPLRLQGSEDQYSVELVEVPVARWTSPAGKSTLWVLFDGNFNGVYDRRFGDAMLADLTGERRISSDPESETFFSYHLPLRLPWGAYEVADLDPRGRFAVLRRMADQAAAKLVPLAPGDATEPARCQDLAGRPLSFGGATNRHQLLFFWLSSCPACAADAEALAPALARIGAQRLSPVGISLDEDATPARRFAEENGLAWPHCFSGTMLWDNAVFQRFGVTAPSTFVLLDPQGRIVYRGLRFENLRPILEKTFGGTF